MVWRSAATVTIDADGRYLDADQAALDLLGLSSVEQLRATSPERFAAVPADPEEQEAWRRAYAATRADGVLAEGAFRRLDGELVRVRTVITPQPDGNYRALFYPVERPTTNLATKVYRIADVLAEWRGAERRLVEVDPETEEGQAVAAEVELLRGQYHVLAGKSAGARAQPLDQ